MHEKQRRLEAGETFTTSEGGNSMAPKIHSRQKHVLAPIKLEDVVKGDIVFCKVGGKYYTHLVRAIGPRGAHIYNNKGRENGWTKQVFGKVIEVLPR
jgi:hypothetical protein